MTGIYIILFVNKIFSRLIYFKSFKTLFDLAPLALASQLTGFSETLQVIGLRLPLYPYTSVIYSILKNESFEKSYCFFHLKWKASGIVWNIPLIILFFSLMYFKH